MNSRRDANHDVTLVTTRTEVLDVARLRYEVFVEELGHAIPGRCDLTRTVVDSVDLLPTTNVLTVNLGGQDCCGTMRGVNLEFSEYPSYLLGVRELDDLQSFGLEGGECIYCNRFAVKKPYRRSTMSLAIMRKMIDVSFSRAVYFLLYVSPSLQGFYAKIGCFKIGGAYVNSFGEPRILMINPVRDAEHHEKNNTPFSEHIRALSAKHDPSSQTRSELIELAR